LQLPLLTVFEETRYYRESIPEYHFEEGGAHPEFNVLVHALSVEDKYELEELSEVRAFEVIKNQV